MSELPALWPALPRTLPELASVAQREHEAFERDARSAVMHAIRCGEALNAAKAKVRHGEWLPWLADNFSAGERTARNYMRLAANRQRVSDLGTVRGALAELSTPRNAEAQSEDDAAREAKRKRLMQRAAIGAALSKCRHLTPEQWDDFAARCGELWVIELVLVYTYAFVRDAADQELPSGADAAVVAIAMRGADDLRDWARDVVNGERHPDPSTHAVTAEDLRKRMSEYDAAQWAMGDWLKDMGDDCFHELADVAEAVRKA